MAKNNFVLKLCLFTLIIWGFCEAKIETLEGVGTNKEYFIENDVISNANMISNDTSLHVVQPKDKFVRNISSEILQWWKSAHPDVSKQNIHKMLRHIQVLSESRSQKHQKDMRIEKYMKDKSIVAQKFLYPKRNITNQFWNQISSSNRKTDDLQKIFELNKDEFNAPRLYHPHMILDTMNLKDLTVKRNVTFKSINKQPNGFLKLKNINTVNAILKNDFNVTQNYNPAQRVSTQAQYFFGVTAKTLKVFGEINTVNASNFHELFLKRYSNKQNVLGVLNTKRLTAKNISLQKLINGDVISQIVLTSGGKFIVNQDIMFSKPIYAQKLIVNERLNNVHVLQGKLQVLYTNMSEIQVISASKTFENVKLLEPIVLQGQIKSSKLDMMNPVSTLYNDIILNGDFIISGLVTISDILTGHNVYDSLREHNFINLIEYGIQKSSPEIDLNLSFRHVIRSKKAKAFSVNKQLCEEFLITGIPDLQEIKEKKFFATDLHVHNGKVMAENIDGVNIELLQQTVLHNVGTQNISGSIHFKRIIAPTVFCDNEVLLGETTIGYILNSHLSQELSSSLVVRNITSQNLKVLHLESARWLFDVDINHIVEDSAHLEITAPFTGNISFIGDLTVNNFQSDSIINKLISVRPLVETINSIKTLREANGPMTISNSVKISSISSIGNINGIPTNVFGLGWLLRKYNQIFTKPQNFSYVSSELDLIINGYINNRNLSHIILDSLWCNRDESLNVVTFDSTVYAYGSIHCNKQLNAFNLQYDFLFVKSSYPQKLRSISCNKNVSTTNITILKTINNLNLDIIQKIVLNQLNDLKIIVKNASFSKITNLMSINSRNIQDMFHDVWLINDPIELEGNWSFHNVLFDRIPLFDGSVNGVNLLFLAENYFSLTMEQQVLSQIFWKKYVIFDNTLDIQLLNLAKGIADTRSQISVDFSHFITNILTRNTYQEISGTWTINTGIVSDNLNNVLINELNLNNDVLRYDMPAQNITAIKYFDSATVHKLYCGQKCKVNDILMKQWIEKSVFIHGNYTIQGITTFQMPYRYIGIEVLGLVNRMKFNKQTVLLNNTQQKISSNVHIYTKYPEDNKIMSLAFENLYLQKLKGIDVSTFLHCLVDQQILSVSVNTSFIANLNTDHLQTGGKLYQLNTKQFVDKYHQGSHIADTLKLMKNFNNLVYKTAQYNGLKRHPKQLQDIQHIGFAWKKAIKYETLLKEEFIAASETTNDNCIWLYSWDHTENLLTISKDLSWCGSLDKTVIDIYTLQFQNEMIICAKIFDKTTLSFAIIFLKKSGLSLEIILSYKLRNGEHILPNVTKEEACFFVYSNKNPGIKIICLVYSMQQYRLQDKRYYQVSQCKKAYVVEQGLMLVSQDNRIEIWYPHKENVPHTIIYSGQIVSVATITYEFVSYVAVLINHGIKQTVDLYRSMHYDEYISLQSLETLNAIEVKFAVHPQFENLILYVVTSDKSRSVIVYNFKGSSGFIEETAIDHNMKISSVFDYNIAGHQLLFITSDKVRIMEFA